MTTLEKIKKEIQNLNLIGYADVCGKREIATKAVLEIIDRYASEECDRDCEHCAYLECPKEPCEDAVSRQAVLKAIDKWYENNNQLFLSDCVEDLIIAINYELPSVQPKAKTGRWVDDVRCEYFVCNQCKAEFERFSEGGCELIDEYHFCPNCGAEMKGGAE